MKIGVDGRLINKSQNTGISRYTLFLIDYYISRYGVENVYVITNDSALQISQCRMRYTHLSPYNIFHFIKYWKFVKREEFEILHVPYYSSTIFKLRNTKVIVTVHDLMYYLISDFFGRNILLNFLKKQYFNFIVKRSILTSDVVISVSETTKNDLYKFFNISSVVIPEVSQIEAHSNKNIIKKLGLENKKYFFYCGNARPHKNLNLLRNIFEKESNLPPLVLAGNGHNKGKNIIAAGIVSEEELKALYESSIAFVFPSKYEGFGLPILEALILEKPVVASNIPAFLEFKSKNIIYFSVNSENELLEALRKAQFYQFKAETSLFDHYSVDNIYTKLDKLFR